ncbi:MAG: type IV secretory system conjugative DNA transfer family protein [Bacteroidales bacterium]|nr:type IV secretory system conjugative DNA transfer family protein [Lachnoclostridium sp.]MCM1385621.1 type IV secretory system conjugative DNA transfer family protein [Lachnoclostridium sp.]MCM1466432.1 type IV secretory system conjugative DNA transfer family protein [Bacteroidales bacterium]
MKTKNRNKGKLVLAEGVSYNMDCYETKLNNNVLVVGTSGAGKTRSIVTPNLLSANGSYVVSDPKGNLYQKYRNYLQKEGYVVKLLDFTHPEKSAHYNPFHYIRCEQDIVKIAHMLIYAAKFHDIDPFWDQAAQLLVEGIIGFQWEFMPPEERNLSVMLDLLDMCEIEGEYSEKVNNVLDDKIEEIEQHGFGDSFGPKHYKRFRQAASKTAKSILIDVTAKLAAFDTKELREMLSHDDLDIASIGKRKTVLFVVVSDTDRSMDTLANLFFTQAMNELCYYADNACPDNELPIPVQFILDDFATNCRIDEFPRMIASIRSRGISVMLMIQAQSQLEQAYREDSRTIIGNCDTYIYLGGNDLETADAVAKRCDLPLKNILNMPVGQNWIFRRGQMPINGKNLDLEKYIEKIGLKREKVMREGREECGKRGKQPEKRKSPRKRKGRQGARQKFKRDRGLRNS